MSLLLLAGCGGGSQVVVEPPTPSERPPTDARLIAGVLQQRARVIEEEQRRIGLRDARFVLEKLDVQGASAEVRARLAYGIRGVRGRFGSPHDFEMERKAGRWRVERVLGDRDREPWEVGEVTRSDSPHFVGWALSGAITPGSALAVGYDRLRDTLGDQELKQRYLVVIAPDGDATRAITRQITGLEQLSAVTDTQVKIGGPAEQVRAVRSQRLIINAAAFDATDPASQEQVAAHELTHAVLAPRTSTRVPGWLVEGIALYASGDDRRPEYFSLTTFPTLAGLTEPDAIAMLTGEAQRAAYATASAAAFYITDTYGEDALLELLDLYSRPALAGNRGDPRLTDKAMKRVLGIGLDEFQERLG